MRCSNCGKDIDEFVFPPPLTYCPYCGLKLKESGAEETEGMHFCPHCGKELPGRVSFCPYCGGEIGRRVTTGYAGVGGIEPAERRAKPIIEVPPEQRKKRGKLFKQWIKYANLPPEVIPSTETPTDKSVGQVKNLQRLPVLYILLIFCIVILFAGFVLLLMQSC